MLGRMMDTSIPVDEWRSHELRLLRPDPVPAGLPRVWHRLLLTRLAVVMRMATANTYHLHQP